jgi:uroporphyrinogen decarboxylase
VDTIDQEVKKNIEAFMPGGGYVFNNVHNIQAKVSPQNIVALFDAAYKYGFYTLQGATFPRVKL